MVSGRSRLIAALAVLGIAWLVRPRPATSANGEAPYQRLKRRSQEARHEHLRRGRFPCEVGSGAEGAELDPGLQRG